jgi:large subunit ribosomal protein L25
VVELAIEGEKTPHQTLIREIQTHPYRGYLVHVDFLRIQAGVKVDMNVPLHLIGDPVGVREHGGVLEQTIHDIPITCIPSAIPESIDVDVTALDLHDTLHVSDLVVAEGIEIQLPPERTICSVSVPRAVVEETDEDEDELAEVEVIGEEADDEEGEGEE